MNMILWGVFCGLFSLILYWVIKDGVKNGINEAIGNDLSEIKELLEKILRTRLDVGNIERDLSNINKILSDLKGKADFKWGFSKHFPGEFKEERFDPS